MDDYFYDNSQQNLSRLGDEWNLPDPELTYRRDEIIGHVSRGEKFKQLTARGYTPQELSACSRVYDEFNLGEDVVVRLTSPVEPLLEMGIDIGQLSESLLSYTLTNPKTSVWTNKKPGEETVDNIIESLLGPKTAKPRNWKFNPANRAECEKNIASMVKQELPIDAICMFSLRKNFGIDHFFVSPDLAELTALRRLVCINNDVKKVYPPGLRIRIIMEDLAGEILHDQNPQIVENMREYAKRLEQLGKILAPDLFEFQRESLMYQEKVASTGKVKDFKDHTWAHELVKKYASIFMDYLKESEEKGCIPEDENDLSTDYQNLESYKKLKELGWQGSVSKKHRDYFCERASREFGWQANSKEFTEKLSIFLGSVLARKKMELIQGKYTLDEGQQIPPIKLSFVQIPPGVPTQLGINRFEYVAQDRSKKSENRVPPWAGEGIIYLDSKKGPKVRIVPQRLYKKTTWTGATLYVQLERDGNKVTFITSALREDIQ